MFKSVPVAIDENARMHILSLTHIYRHTHRPW